MNIKWRTLRGFIRKEFEQILRSKQMIVALVFIPVVQLVMFGSALTSEVKNIKFVVVSKPTKIAQQIEERALSSGWFKEVKDINGAQVLDPADILIRQKAEAVLVAPKEGFEYALEHGDKPIQLLINAVNAQRAQQVDTYVKQIIAEIAVANGYDINAMSLINMDIRVMYNHYMNTSDFMIPALIAMATFIVLLVVCSMSIAKEKETGTMEKLIASPSGPAEILLGKTLPYFFIGIFIILFMFAVGLIGFGIPLRGYFWQLLVTGALLNLTALSVATLLSTVAKTQQQAMMGSILFILPAILLSGVFFPVENIPSMFRWLSYLDPLTYSMINFRTLMLKGGDMALFWQNSIIAFLMGIVLAALAYKNFKSTLN
ncbi:ABC-2 type transport system permease protein [Elusimicrobium posterum]|uniref:ABC transporter permease n=1 Tax=Elusimicrobium posterum TaxID=3116653 RepID=UPI003C708E23